jgi:hypothetical protein
MAGAALTAVESQIGIINGYATSAIAAAETALGTLSAIAFPTSYPPSWSITLPTYTPSGVSTPSMDGLETAPAIQAISVPTIPDKPTIDTVTLGAILAINLPEVPTISFPSITLDPPVYNISTPTQWTIAPSTDILISGDPMIQAAITRLAANIETGGTGLSATVEDAIWDREREREEQQLSDTTDKITTAWAKKGWSLPDGLLADSLSEAQVEYLNRNLSRAREIAVEQGKLEQTNIFKSLELSVSLASTLIKMLVDYETLVVGAQESTAKFANEYIDIQIKTYASKVEAYKSTAQVHEMIIRAELAKVEVYRAQIEGQKLIGDVNTQTVQIYVEKLRATSILIERYRTEVQAMTAELEGEKLKIESNNLQLDSWAKKANVVVSKYNADIEKFKSETQFNISASDLMARQAESGARISVSLAETDIKAYEVQERSLLSQQNTIMEAARGVAQATAAMASGAMAAMSAHASMSYSESQPLAEIEG